FTPSGNPRAPRPINCQRVDLLPATHAPLQHVPPARLRGPPAESFAFHPRRSTPATKVPHPAFGRGIETRHRLGQRHPSNPSVTAEIVASNRGSVDVGISHQEVAVGFLTQWNQVQRHRPYRAITGTE